MVKESDADRNTQPGETEQGPQTYLDMEIQCVSEFHLISVERMN